MLRDDDSVSDQAYIATAIELITNRDSTAGGGPAAAAPKSWIELRYVKRRGKVYGPYRYRRWREGGRMRSRYLGKANECNG